MANSFTNILPVLTKAAQVVSRESVGMLRSVNLDASPQGVNLGATINLPKAPAASSTTWTPAVNPTTADTTATGVQLSLTLAKEVPWHVTAEQASAMNKGDATAMRWFELQASQAFRTLANTIELYLWGLARLGSSRAIGTAGTTPFASTLAAAAQVAQILDENGAPAQGRSLVMNPACAANAKALFANVASTQDRSSFGAGILPEISGLMPQMSNQIAAVTKGTGASYLVNKTANLAVGDTTIPMDTGSGTILAGDVFLIGTGGLYYVAKTALAAGSLTINDPGIYKAALNNAVVTVQATHVQNIALSRDALYAVVRPPLQDPDLASSGQEQVTVVDPVSGIAFGVYKKIGDGLTHYSARVIYGGVVVESRHIATLMG